jgi:tocopherol O-methyltransferase
MQRTGLPMDPSSATISGADVARHYDQLDRYYREIWGEHVHHGYWKNGGETREEAARAMVDAVIERAQVRPGMDVLDVGCGYGATARVIARECGARVVGVTISEKQHRHAGEGANPGGNPAFVLEDWLQNQRPSSSFDVVISIESTEHMPEKPRVFSEMARVMKPGGRLVVVAWLAGDHRTPWQDTHLVEPICRAGRLAEVGTAGEYRNWIRDAGLELEGETDISKQVSKTWPMCAWRFATGLLRHPSHLRLLLSAANEDRMFATTVIRIWLAYRLEAMRMVIFTASKPA